jgi:hypothetical protein
MLTRQESNLQADQYVITKNGNVLAVCADIHAGYDDLWELVCDDIAEEGPQPLGGLADRYTLRGYDGTSPFSVGDHIRQLDGTEWTIEEVHGRSYDETDRIALEHRRLKRVLNS